MKVTIKKIAGHPKILFAAVIIGVDKNFDKWIWEETDYYIPDREMPRYLIGQVTTKPNNSVKFSSKKTDV